MIEATYNITPENSIAADAKGDLMLFDLEHQANQALTSMFDPTVPIRVWLFQRNGK